MPRMLAASRGARSFCMRIKIDGFMRQDNTILFSYGKRLQLTPSGSEDFPPRSTTPTHKENLRPEGRSYRGSPSASSVAQRFAGFQGVGDALLGFLFATEGNEGFALEVENVLFANQLRGGERAAGENVGKLAGDVRVVIGSVAPAHQHVDGQLGGREERLAEDFDLRALRPFLPTGRGGLPAAAREREGGLLSIPNEAFAIHRIGVRAAKVAEFAALFGTRADLGHGDIFEDGPQSMEEVEIVSRGSSFVGADQHFFRAAAAGDEADAGFNEADIGFRRGVNFCRMQADFAAAAERHALRRGNNRLRCVLDGEV